MKLQWAIIIFILIMVSCKSQIGIYCTKPAYTVSCYELKKNGKFNYSEGTCIGGSQGIGDYEIVEDTIKFSFKTPQIKKGRFRLDKIKEIEKGIIVDLMVIDSQSREPIIGYSAIMYSDDVLISGEPGDLKGKARLATVFNQKPIKIEISFMGFYSLDFEINEGGEYSVLAEIKSSGIFSARKQQDRVYRLIKLNKDSLVIGEFGEDDWHHVLYRYE